MVYVTDPQKLLTPPAQLYLSRAHCYLSLGRPLLALSDANKALKVTIAICSMLLQATIIRNYFVKTQTSVASFSPPDLSIIF